MDLKDRKILQELSKNSRLPLKKLAKTVQMSESSLSYRIERLQKNEILLNTNTIINSYRLGHTGYRTYLKYSGTTPEIETNILNWLILQKETSVVGSISQESEIGFMSWVKNPTIFQKFINKLKENFGEYIENLDISQYIGTRYYSRKYLNPSSEAKEIIVLQDSKVHCDELDMNILKILNDNSRKSSLEISRELEKPVKTIINRIKRLELLKIIEGYSINLNVEKIGYEYYKLNIIFSKNTNYSQLLEWAKHLNNSIYVDETIGKFDFELNLEVENKNKLKEIIKEIKEKFGGIKLLEIKQIEKYHKLKFL